MVSFESLRAPIKSWITARTGLLAIVKEQNSPQPAKTYCTFKFSSSEKVYEDSISAPDALGVATICGNREFQLEVQAFGPGANTALCKLRDSIQLPSVRISLRLSGLLIIDAEPIIDITSLEDNSYIEKANCDFRCRIASSETDTIGAIEAVEIDGSLRNVDNSTASVVSIDLNTVSIIP